MQVDIGYHPKLHARCMSYAGRVVVFHSNRLERKEGSEQSVGNVIFRVGRSLEEGPLETDRNPTKSVFYDQWHFHIQIRPESVTKS